MDLKDLNKIIENFKNLPLTKQVAQEASFLEQLQKIVLPEADVLDFLSIPSSYLKTVSIDQQAICRDLLTENAQFYEKLSNEVKLAFLTTQSNPNEEHIAKLYLTADNKDDLQYKMTLRPFLVKYGLVNKSVSSQRTTRKEINLLKAHFRNHNGNGICAMLKALTNFDFRDFSPQEKSVLLEIMKINEPYVEETMPQVVTEDKIRYGTWKNFWHTVSNYALTQPKEANTILTTKHFCINSDYEDERIDMSFFPHLPTIYDENDLTDSKTFLNNIDWSQDFYDYELDFILAANMDNYDKEQYGQIIEKVKTRIGR